MKPPETRTIQLTAKHAVHLTQLTHSQLIIALGLVNPMEKHKSLKPPPMAGYTHELALENSSGYREQWEKYEAAVNRENPFIWMGASWQAAWLDMEGDTWKEEVDEAIAMGEKFGLHAPNRKDALDLGGLIYALIERRNPTELSEIIYWLREGAGLIDASVVEAERKSAVGDGEQPAPAGS